MTFFVGAGWAVSFCGFGTGAGRGIRAGVIRVRRRIVRTGWNRRMRGGGCGECVADVVSVLGGLDGVGVRA
jgi:hypothetical protein